MFNYGVLFRLSSRLPVYILPCSSACARSMNSTCKVLSHLQWRAEWQVFEPAPLAAAGQQWNARAIGMKTRHED